MGTLISCSPWSHESKMLKHIAQLVVSFNPAHGRQAQTARLVLNKVLTEDSLASNPNCEIKAEVHADDTPASIKVLFNNTKEPLEFTPESGSVTQVLHSIAGTQQRIENDL